MDSLPPLLDGRRLRRGAYVDRFWPRVAIKGAQECWLWQGGTNGRGYGIVGIKHGAPKQAHKVAYELVNGPVPSNMHLHHRCQNPLCVNPAHLELLTPSEHGKHHRLVNCSRCGGELTRLGARATCRPCENARKRNARLDPAVRARESEGAAKRYLRRKQMQ